MWPTDNEERLWAALTHLKMSPGEFLSRLDDEIPEANDKFAWLVRCNPLMQLRSVILDFEADWDDSGARAELRDLLEKHDKRVTKNGLLDCGIYTKKKFISDDVWSEIRGIARESLVQCGLPEWDLPIKWSYKKFATWDEIEDELFAVIVDGGVAKSLPWVRKQASGLWEPE